jgi:N-ethylmaleimide reductase
LIVTEASQISPQGKGYSFTPGIYSANQIEGWRLVTRSVHAAGGRIFLQLWHVGRMSHPDFHDGELPVAPSAVPFDGQVWKVDPATGVGAMVACPTPRALTQDEIRSIVEDFRRAARNAIHAGFDGVEIHGANGYLVDQFCARHPTWDRRIRRLACEPPALPGGGGGAVADGETIALLSVLRRS